MQKYSELKIYMEYKGKERKWMKRGNRGDGEVRLGTVSLLKACISLKDITKEAFF